MRRHRYLAAALAALVMVEAGPASARIEKPLVKIGILNDMSGPYADLGGPG